MEILGGWDSSLRKVPFESLDQAWSPVIKAERDALAYLLSQTNRSELRAWYAQTPSLNPVARAFHQYLEERIGEPLPLMDIDKE